jgi:hypothetical protein
MHQVAVHLLPRGWCIQKFPEWIYNEITIINTRWEATQRVMASKLSRLTYKIAIQLHIVAESCTICGSRSRWWDRKLLDTPSYFLSVCLDICKSTIYYVPVCVLALLSNLFLTPFEWLIWYNRSRNSSVVGCGLGDRGFESRYVLGIFLLTTASRQALGPIQPPIQWIPGALSLGVKRPGLEAVHSPQSSAEVKNAWRHNSTPQYTFMSWWSVKKSDINLCRERNFLPFLYLQLMSIYSFFFHWLLQSLSDLGLP